MSLWWCCCSDRCRYIFVDVFLCFFWYIVVFFPYCFLLFCRFCFDVKVFNDFVVTIKDTILLLLKHCC